MVAKQKVPSQTEATEKPWPKGLSPKQEILFAAIRRLFRYGGQVTSGRLRESCSEISSASLLYNLQVLEKLGYVRSEHKPDGSRLELGERALKEEYLWRLVDEGIARWNGGHPKGSKNPVRITPGPPVSDYVIQDRG